MAQAPLDSPASTGQVAVEVQRKVYGLRPNPKPLKPYPQDPANGPLLWRRGVEGGGGEPPPRLASQQLAPTIEPQAQVRSPNPWPVDGLPGITLA